MIDNKVKLVVWDLDDTFWRGALSEEEVVPIGANVEAVVALSKRGIINSVCSKNDFEQAKARLIELGVYDYFVFLSIGFNPKGKAVAQIIEGAALRAENVLFLDDNRMNLEEVKYFNPGIMACHPRDLEALGGLLDHPHLAGNPDPQMTRLKQYQFLQRKVEERSTSALSNEEFLRASRIRVTIDQDVEGNFERVVELINRSNQLNYTKKRLNMPEEVEAFRALLRRFGYHAGCVRAMDSYGDYGLIGFFLLHRRARIKKLIHFVFSCRTMHMGIEQHIYEVLGRPDVDVVQPVSYGLNTHASIDWINASYHGEEIAVGTAGPRLLLLGGCELLQLASYCSANRTEFVNKTENGIVVRYDDPGFVLSDRDVTGRCKSIRRVPCWTHKDAVKFDEEVALADLILVSFWRAMKGSFYRTKAGVLLHFNKQSVNILRSRHKRWFREDVEEVSLDDKGRHHLVMEAFHAIARTNGGRGQIFILGSYTQSALKPESIARRRAFNEACRNFCTRQPETFFYVDVDAIVSPAHLVDNSHFTREGYFAIAKHILRLRPTDDGRHLRAMSRDGARTIVPAF